MTEKEAFERLMELVDNQRCYMMALAQALTRQESWESHWVKTWDLNTMIAITLGLPVRSANKIMGDAKEIWELERLFGDDPMAEEPESTS